METNKEIAVNFLNLIVDRQVDKAFELYVDMNGKHHSPYYPAGFEALKKGMIDADATIVEKKLTVEQVIGEDDMVSVYVHLALSPYDMAVVYLFKFENNKIVEMWDCGMPVPENIPNTDGVF